MRACLMQIRSGETDSNGTHAITRLHEQDDWARVDHCIAGFLALLRNLLPELDASPLKRMQHTLAAGELTTPGDVDVCMATIKQAESLLVGTPIDRLHSAVRTEEIRIQLEAAEIVHNPQLTTGAHHERTRIL